MTSRRGCVAFCALVTSCSGGEEGWNSAFQRMVDQPKLDAYEMTELNGGMRHPPEGTVAREDAPSIAHGIQQRAEVMRVRASPNATATAFGGSMRVDSAGESVTLVAPRWTRELMARGRDRFDIFCSPCHGTLGDGHGPVAPKMELRRPPSLHDPRLARMPAEDLFVVISLGYGLMPSYAAPLTVEDRWAVVGYVKALQASQHAALGEVPVDVREEFRRQIGSE